MCNWLYHYPFVSTRTINWCKHIFVREIVAFIFITIIILRTSFSESYYGIRFRFNIEISLTPRKYFPTRFHPLFREIEFWIIIYWSHFGKVSCAVCRIFGLVVHGRPPNPVGPNRSGSNSVGFVWSLRGSKEEPYLHCEDDTWHAVPSSNLPRSAARRLDQLQTMGFFRSCMSSPIDNDAWLTMCRKLMYIQPPKFLLRKLFSK